MSHPWVLNRYVRMLTTKAEPWSKLPPLSVMTQFARVAWLCRHAPIFEQLIPMLPLD